MRVREGKEEGWRERNRGEAERRCCEAKEREREVCY